MIRCCGTCGKVLDQEIYTDEPNFVKDSTGQVGFASMPCNTFFFFLFTNCSIDMFWPFGAIQSRLAGRILTSIESGYSMSHQRTLEKGMNFGALILRFVLLCELIFILNFTGKDEISQIVNNLHVSGGDTIISKALKYYEVYISIISPCCLIGIQYNDFDVSSF